MKQGIQYLLSGLVLVTVFAGCGQRQFPPNNLADAQRIYQQTKWCSTQPLVRVSRLASGAVDISGDSTQCALQFSDGRRTIFYSELIASPFGIKTFHGAGKLVAILNLNAPIFIAKDETVAEDISNQLVGFSGNRMFRVYSVDFSGDTNSPNVRMAEMLQVATNACAELKRLSDKNL